jgi:hypothetical protein
MRKRSSASIAWQTTGRLLVDALNFLSFGFRYLSRLAAENLFLRNQLALFVERRVRSRLADDATRLTLVVLGACPSNRCDNHVPSRCAPTLSVAAPGDGRVGGLCPIEREE